MSFFIQKNKRKTGVMDVKKIAKAIRSRENNMDKLEGG